MINQAKFLTPVFISLLWTTAIQAQSTTVVIPLYDTLEIVQSATSTDDVDPEPGRKKVAKTVCPLGTTLIGGGGSEDGTLVMADSSSTLALWGTAWKHHPGNTVPTDVTVYAMCIKGCLSIQNTFCGSS